MKPATRNILIVIVTVLVAFGIGAAWQFAQANSARRELVATEAMLEGVRHELELEKLQSTLALATAASQLGNYERARQLMSEFFNGLQTAEPSAPEAARTAFSEILASRDQTITSLSRAEPDAGLELARMIGKFREALGRESVGLSPSMPMPGTMAPAAADTMN